MDAAFTPVDCLQQGGPITSSIFPASCKGGADWLIPVVVPRENYGSRTPRQEKARLDSVHDAVLEELRQKRRAEGKSHADFPRDIPSDEGEQLLSRLAQGEVKLFNANVGQLGANAGATRGLPGTPGTRFSVASAPGADKALFSATLRSCAHLGAGLAVVWESTWGDAWWALWRANIDAFHEKGMDVLVLFSGDAKAGEANIGFAQSMEVLYLQERRVPFSTMAITDFKRYTQGAVLTQATQNAWVALEPTLRLRPGSVACQLRTVSGATALHVAAGCRAPASCLAALVRCGWDADAKDDAGFTPLHAAAAGVFDEEVESVKAEHFRNCPEQVAELLRLRADPKATSRTGMTPLHSAARFSGSTEVVALLLASHADVAAQTTVGNTPLGYAAMGGHTQVAKLLLEAGANLEHRNIYGKSPLDMACGKQEVLEALGKPAGRRPAGRRACGCRFW